MTVQAIEPLVCGRPVPSLDRAPLIATNGQVLADVGLAPRLVAQAALIELRQHAHGVPPDHALFVRAADLFASGRPGDETYEQYEINTSSTTGLAASTLRRSTRDLVAEITNLPVTTQAELPPQLISAGIRVSWVPSGRVFAAVMASNHPVPNISWVQALYHGYSVIV